MRPGVEAGGKFSRSEAGACEQGCQHRTRVSGATAGGVGVKRHKQLAVGELLGEQVRGVGHQRGLTHTGHAVDGMDGDDLGLPRSLDELR